MPRRWPITYEDVVATRQRIRPRLRPTALRRYVELDRTVAAGLRVLVKHENHQPTNSFKVRNALSALTVIPQDQRSRGVIAASRGNHGQGLAWAGQLLGIRVVICVPEGNNPETNAAIRGFCAELVIESVVPQNVVCGELLGAMLARRDRIELGLLHALLTA